MTKYFRLSSLKLRLTMPKKPFSFFAGDQNGGSNNGSTPSNDNTTSNFASTQSSSIRSPYEPSPSQPSYPSRSSQQDGNIASLITDVMKQICANDPIRIESLKQHILTLLLSGQSDDMIQGDLIDTFGFEHFELVSQILNQKERVLDELLNTAATTNGIIESKDTRHSTPVETDEEYPTVSNFSIQTKSESKQRKEDRKEKRRAHKEMTKIVAGLEETDKIEYALALREHEKRM